MSILVFFFNSPTQKQLQEFPHKLEEIKKLDEVVQDDAKWFMHLMQTKALEDVKKSQAEMTEQIQGSIVDQIQKVRAGVTSQVQELSSKLSKDIVGALSQVIDSKIEGAVQKLRDEIPSIVKREVEGRFGPRSDVNGGN